MFTCNFSPITTNQHFFTKLLYSSEIISHQNAVFMVKLEISSNIGMLIHTSLLDEDAAKTFVFRVVSFVFFYHFF